MDVKNVILNGDLSEEIYLKPPPGFEHLLQKVCHFLEALYGLKQSPRAWFSKFSSVLAQQGFTPTPYDSALFIRRSKASIVLILLYIDEMVITSDDRSGIQTLRQFLNQQFEIKDLGSLNYFFGS